MRYKDKNLERIVILVLILSLAIHSNSNSIQTVTAATGVFVEDFTTTTYMDAGNTNTSGWGSGRVEISKKKPTIVGSISSTLIGNTLDVVVDGDYAYVTNEADGLKVVNITDPTNPHIIGSYSTDGTAYSVFIDGDHVFIADDEGGFPDYENILVLNVTDPTSPEHLGNCSIFFNQNDAARNIVVDGDNAYVANLEKGIRVVNITNPENPAPIGVRDTAGTAHKLFIEGNYAYVADGTNGLVVLNITNPTNPIATTTYTTGLSNVIDVVIEGNYAYVVDATNGLIVVNITDPTTPSLTGSYPNSQLNGAFVDGDFLYLLDLTDGLFVVNITDPTTPTLINSVSLPGNPYSIDIDGYYAYIACYAGGLQIVRIADSITPTFAGSYNTPDTTYGIALAGDYAYVADSASGLQILDISDPTTPTFAGSYNTPGSARMVALAGDYAYVAIGFSGVQVIEISDPSNPTLAGSYDTPGFAYYMTIAGDYAYVADAGSGLQIINITDPTTPTLAGSYNTPGDAHEVTIAGNYAYVADQSSGLQVINITDPTTPTFAGSYDTPDTAFGIALAGDYAYVADYRSLEIIDISNPLTPSFVVNYTTPNYAWDAMVAGDYAYVANDHSGLQVINITDPTTPTFAGSYNTPSNAYGVVVVGDYAYVADGDSGLQVIEIQRTKSRIFDSPCYSQSIAVVSDSSITITNATLSATDSLPVSTTIDYYLSADNGANWEAITPGVEHDFTNTGFQLKWKAELSTSDNTSTPEIFDLSIDYSKFLISPSLNTPAEGYNSEDNTPTFTWFGINGESNYLFQLDITTSFTTPLLNITIPSSSASYTPSSPLAIGTYYWRVAGIDSDGDLGAFSSYRSITILQDIINPIINQPTDISYQLGDTGNSIIWMCTDNNPATYIVYRDGTQIETDTWTSGSTIVISVDGLAIGSYIYSIVIFDASGNSALDYLTVDVTPAIPEMTYLPSLLLITAFLAINFLFIRRRLRYINK